MTLTKNQRLLYTAVTNIDETYVEEALNCKKKTVHTAVKRFAAVAATLILLMTLSYVWNAFYYGPEDVTLIGDGPFIITAGATDGNKKENIPEYLEKLLSSYSNGYEPVSQLGDHVLFSMNLKPNNWNGEGWISRHYKLEIQYDNTIVNIDNNFDRHVAIYFTTENNMTVYSILGWFYEPTEMTITFLDAETGSIVQEQIILVVYDSAAQSYAFTVQNAQR